MIIPIDDLHRIASDRYQWVLQERKVHKGKEKWLAVGYFSRLDSLLSACFDLKLRLADTEGLDEAMQEARKIAALLQRALSYRSEAA